MGPLTTFSFQTTETNRSSHQRAAHLEEVSCQGPLQRSASPLVGNLSSLALPKGAYAVYTPQFALATLPVPVWSQAGPSGGFPQQDSHSHGDGDAPFRYYEENSIVSNDEQTIQSDSRSPTIGMRSRMQELPSQELRCNSNPIPRSRAIRIERSSKHDVSNRNVDDDFDEIPGSGSTERMYEWATWRMYNRITDHRQRHPVKISPDDTSSAGAPHAPQWSHSYGNTNLPHHETNCRSQEQDQDYFFDGEVFDLEI